MSDCDKNKVLRADVKDGKIIIRNVPPKCNHNTTFDIPNFEDIDVSKVPRIFRWLLPTKFIKKYNNAKTIHEYLYTIQDFTEERDDSYVDEVLLDILYQNGCSYFGSRFYYYITKFTSRNR